MKISLSLLYYIQIQVTDGNTKGLIGHIEALHHQMAQKWREVRDANDIKKQKMRSDIRKGRKRHPQELRGSRNWQNRIPRPEVTR